MGFPSSRGRRWAGKISGQAPHSRQGLTKLETPSPLASTDDMSPNLERSGVLGSARPGLASGLPSCVERGCLGSSCLPRVQQSHVGENALHFIHQIRVQAPEVIFWIPSDAKMDKEKEQERLWNGERKEPREKESMSLTQHWNWSFRNKVREYANDRHLAKAPPHARVCPSSGESHPRTSVLSDKKMKMWGE